MAYTGKTNWTNNEIVEAVDMNRIEQGIADNDTGLINHKNNTSNPHNTTAAQAGAVPNTRKVNNKQLNADISLSAADVGAAGTSHSHGNITNDGAIGTTEGLPVFTTTAGAITTQTAAGARNLLGLGNTSGALPIANGGTGVTSMTGTDYSTVRPRGISLSDTEPVSVGNGCIMGVYE